MRSESEKEKRKDVGTQPSRTLDDGRITIALVEIDSETGARKVMDISGSEENSPVVVYRSIEDVMRDPRLRRGAIGGGD